jgi:hypothetical protein
MSEIGWFGFVVFAEFAESMFFSSTVANSAAKDAETWNATDVVGNTCRLSAVASAGLPRAATATSAPGSTDTERAVGVDRLQFVSTIQYKPPFFVPRIFPLFKSGRFCRELNSEQSAELRPALKGF